MRGFRSALGALGLVGATVMSVGASAAAPGALDPETSKASAIAGVGATGRYQLDVEMTVKNWVLCVSQPLAEGLLKARETSEQSFAAAYSEAAAAHTCGQMAEMHVKLEKAVYESASSAPGHGMVYDALVNLSGGWATAFVLPSE